MIRQEGGIYTSWITPVVTAGFIHSGKSGKKVPFTQGVMESQGSWKFLHEKSGKVREKNSSGKWSF